MIITVLVLFGGVSTVGLSAMTPQELAGSWATDPVAGIAHAISMAITPQEMAATLSSGTEVVIVLTWIFTGLRNLLPVLVAVLAASILFVATNAGLMGISRLAFSLGRYQLIPPVLGRVHQRFKTPYISIIIFSAVALVILVPGFFAPRAFLELGALYAFGSLLSFVLAHASIMSLRIKNPDLPRPFRLRWNIKFRQRELPVTAILGLLGTAAVWLVVIFTQPYSRWVGFGWMIVGLVIYAIFRWRRKAYSNKVAGAQTGSAESQ
jgi:APA family basic amino acid/polyamine antiporter